MTPLRPAQSPPLVRIPIVLVGRAAADRSDIVATSRRRSSQAPDPAAEFCYTSFLLDRAGLAGAMDLDVEAVKLRITTLRDEHRDLDDAITRLSEQVPANNLHL